MEPRQAKAPDQTRVSFRLAERSGQETCMASAPSAALPGARACKGPYARWLSSAEAHAGLSCSGLRGRMVSIRRHGAARPMPANIELPGLCPEALSC